MSPIRNVRTVSSSGGRDLTDGEKRKVIELAQSLSSSCVVFFESDAITVSIDSQLKFRASDCQILVGNGDTPLEMYKDIIKQLREGISSIY